MFYAHNFAVTFCICQWNLCVLSPRILEFIYNLFFVYQKKKRNELIQHFSHTVVDVCLFCNLICVSCLHCKITRSLRFSLGPKKMKECVTQLQIQNLK